MAVSMQHPALSGLPSYSWSATSSSASVPDMHDLGLSRLWISSQQSLGPIPSLEGAARLQPDGAFDTTISSARSGGLPPLQQPALHGSRGHYMEPSQPNLGKRLVLNHNKAITKKLASAVHYQQVLDCVGESVQYFDEVNVATALHRLAKLQPPGHVGQPSPVIFADQFQQLIAAVRRLLDRFEAQAVSNTMWAFATLSYFPEDNLLEDLANHAVSIMGTFRPQATSNTLWAFAKLSYCPNKALLHASAAQMLHDLPKSVPQDISNTLWAFATLRFYPGKELMGAAARQAVLTMQHFKPQEIANTLWSFANLGHDPEEQLLDAMAIQMIAKIQQFRPQAVSNSLWSYAKLAYNPGKLLLEVAAQKAVGMLHQYTSQELANTLWALAALGHHPGAPTLDAAAVQIARRIEQFSPQDVSNSLWAFAKLLHHPCHELLSGVALYVLRHWPRFKPAEIAGTLASLAALRACAPPTWQLLLAKVAGVPPADFDDAALQLLFQTKLLIEAAGLAAGVQPAEWNFPQPLMEAAEASWRAAAAAQRGTQPSLMHQEVSQTLWSMGVVHQNRAATADGLFCVDISLDGTNVVLEVQDPSAFSMNSRAILGPSVSRRLMLESRGLAVLGVPFFYWAVLRSQEQRQHFLTSLLASAAQRFAFSPAPELGAQLAAAAAARRSAAAAAPTAPLSAAQLPALSEPPQPSAQQLAPSIFSFEPQPFAKPRQ